MPRRAPDPRIALFITELPKDWNQQAAAIRAGYSPKSAKVTASRLMSRAAVRQAVDAAKNKKLAKNEHAAQRLIGELSVIAHSNILDYVQQDGTVDLSKIPRDIAGAIQELRIEPVTVGEGENAKVGNRIRLKLHPKHPAIDKLGQHFGMWKGERLPETLNLWNVQVNQNVDARVVHVRREVQELFADGAQPVPAAEPGSGHRVLPAQAHRGRGQGAAPRARGKAVAGS